MSTTCGSLHHIFETLLPEKPTLLESLSWNQIKPTEKNHSFTEIFGELHFKESAISSPFTPPHVSTDQITSSNTNNNRLKSSDSFSSLSSESLHLCTEGLGFESSDDVEDFKEDGMNNESSCEVYNKDKVKEGVMKRYVSNSRVISEYPPPISCIGRSGKPWVCFKSYRSEGRFVLEEIRIPTHEFLHACREDGRLKLHFVLPQDEPIMEEDDDDDDDDDGLQTMHEEEEEEENMGEKNDDCVIDAQVTSHSLDERAENLNAKD